MSPTTQTELTWVCVGCKTRIRIGYTSQANKTGAMSTVDCPVCGTNKMIPGAAEKVFHFKDAVWIETRPRASHEYV